MNFTLVLIALAMLAYISAGPWEPATESTGRVVTEEICIEECEADCLPEDHRNEDELQECKDGCQCGCAGFTQTEQHEDRKEQADGIPGHASNLDD